MVKDQKVGSFAQLYRCIIFMGHLRGPGLQAVGQLICAAAAYYNLLAQWRIDSELELKRTPSVWIINGFDWRLSEEYAAAKIRFGLPSYKVENTIANNSILQK
jgi:hypothetical protein